MIRFLTVLFWALLFFGGVCASGKIDNEGEKYMNLADSMDRIGDYDSAFLLYKKAETKFLEKGIGEGYAWAKIRAGNGFLSDEKYYEGVEYYLTVIEDFKNRALPDRDFFVALVNQKLGTLYWRSQNFNAAESHLINSLDYLENCEKYRLGCYEQSPEYLWYSYFYLSVVSAAVFEYEKAEGFARKCISLVEQNENLFKKYGAYSYRELGRLFVKFHHYQKGIKYLSGLLSNTKVPFVNEMYLDLGLCYAEVGMLDSAKFFHQKFMDLALQNNDPLKIASAYEFLGYDYFKTGQLDTSHSYFAEALRLKKKRLSHKSMDVAYTYNLIGRNYFKRGMLDSALHYYQKSATSNISLFDDLSITTNPPLASVTADRNLTTVILFNKGEALLRKYKESGKTEHLNLALNTFLVGDSVLETSRQRITEDSKLALADSMDALYGHAISCSYELYRAGLKDKGIKYGAHFMERNKARILQENLEYIKNNSQSGSDSDSLKRVERFYDFQMDSLKKILVSEENKATPDHKTIKILSDKIFDINKAKRLTIARYEDIGRRQFLSFNLSLPDLQEYCRATNSVILEYTWINHDLFILGINNEQYHFKKLTIDDRFLQHILQFRRYLSTGISYTSLDDYRTFSTSAFYLYQNLIPREMIENRDRLLIIPDGLLNQISFEALIYSRPQLNEVDYKNLDYLIRKFSVAYAYSMNYVLLRKNRDIINYSDIGAFAYEDDIDSVRKNSIVGTSKEVEAIKTSFSNVSFFKGENATEENFKNHAFKYNILHLALHASADSDNKYASSLIFRTNENDEEDGNLFTYEIYNMDLNTDLVVLSACETGLGAYKIGEGAYSVARGFAYAGVPSVVTSLWKVNDHSSIEIMKEFYKELNAGKSIDQSLRSSKLAFLENADEYTAHPNNWAAYILMGNTVKAKTNLGSFLWLISLVALALVSFYLFRSAPGKEKQRSFPAAVSNAE